MDRNKLDRANFLSYRIKEIEDIISAAKNNVRMNIESLASSNKDHSQSMLVEHKKQQEVIDMITKWRDEYQKEFENL